MRRPRSGSQGRVLTGVSGFDVSHRPAALRLFAETTAGKQAGAAAVVIGVEPDNRDHTAEVAAQVIGPGGASPFSRRGPGKLDLTLRPITPP